jgi:dTMP kinase
VGKGGLFVTLEGPDGSGKSTQQRLLAERLRAKGVEVLPTREPGGSELAERIRSLLLDSKQHGLHPKAELLLFEAARAQHVHDSILPALKRGAVVLCDRFTDSSLAYQGAGRSLDLSEVRRLNAFATGGLEPDLTLYYDVDVELGLARARGHKQGSDRMEEADLDFHRRVRQAYLDLAGAEPARVRIIPVGQRSPEALCEDGLSKILERLA